MRHNLAARAGRRSRVFSERYGLEGGFRRVGGRFMHSGRGIAISLGLIDVDESQLACRRLSSRPHADHRTPDRFDGTTVQHRTIRYASLEVRRRWRTVAPCDDEVDDPNRVG